MKKNIEKSTMPAYVLKQAECFQDLLDRVSLVEWRVEKVAGEVEKFKADKKEPVVETRCPSNIIPFPARGFGHIEPRREIPLPACKKANTPQSLEPFLAKPGKPLPPWIPDFRPVLQRDGLILIAWDKRLTEMGERYSAYWVTSNGIPRYYASKPLPGRDFPSASPNHKSYAAEDGIEFHGQDAPAYIIHVAPELMMSNPKHGELRLAHINMLKHHGIKVDFGYKYLLKTDKNRNLQQSKTEYSNHKARA